MKAKMYYLKLSSTSSRKPIWSNPPMVAGVLYRRKDSLNATTVHQYRFLGLFMIYPLKGSVSAQIINPIFLDCVPNKNDISGQILVILLYNNIVKMKSLMHLSDNLWTKTHQLTRIIVTWSSKKAVQAFLWSNGCNERRFYNYRGNHDSHRWFKV